MNTDCGDTSDIYSRIVRAGRRTYFFDVKATRAEDRYLIITESRKMEDPNGMIYYEKHKIHLYKEDFYKYSEELKHAIDYINDNKHGQAFVNGENREKDTE